MSLYALRVTEIRLTNEDALSFIFSIEYAMLQMISSGRVKGEFSVKIFSFSQTLHEPLVKNTEEKYTTIKTRV